MMRKLLSLTIPLFLLGNVAASQGDKEPGTSSADIAPRGFSGHGVTVYLAGYDTSGQLGIGAILNNRVGELCWSLDNFDIGTCRPVISLSANLDAQYAFEPFTFTNDIPFYGKLWGKGLVTVDTPVHYVIPVDKDVAQISEMETQSYSFGAWVGVLPYLLDSNDRPSIGFPTANISGLPSPMRSRGANLIVDYLPGNVLESKVSDSHRFNPGDLLDQKPSMRWGRDTGSIRTNLIRFDDTIPVGPIRVTMAFDGYSTDTVTLNIEEATGYFWNNAAVPVDGISPGASAYFGNDYMIRYDNDFPVGIQLNDAGHKARQLFELDAN